MSWSIEVVGTEEDVVAAIDEAAASQGGMPPSVRDYLKDAVAAVKTDRADMPLLVHVKSSGHRPMESSGSAETAEVRGIRCKPWRAP
jgi:hypothetical protein